MRKEYLKIYEELEKDGSYELAMSKILNEIVVSNKKIDEADKKFKEFEDNYNNYLDMLDSLGIDDEKLELIESLLEKINKYNFIKELIKEVKHNEEIVKQTSNFVLKKNKHTANVLMLISKNPGISHDELASKLNLEKSNLTNALKAIQEYDLISKTKSGRNVHYFLTSNGDKYAEVLKPNMNVLNSQNGFDDEK